MFTFNKFIIQELSGLDFSSVDPSNERDNMAAINITRVYLAKSSRYFGSCLRLILRNKEVTLIHLCT